MAKKVGIKNLIKRVKSVAKFSVKAGILGGRYPDTGIPFAKIAIINEFGAPARNIPPRPFMRNTVKAHEKEWMEYLKNSGERYLKGEMTAERLADGLGSAMQTHILDTIAQGVPPPNAPETVKRKMAREGAEPDLTLVDSDKMRKAISYEYKL